MKKWVRRALRTFFQAAVGYIVVAVPSIDYTDMSGIKMTLVGIGVSAVAAGLAAGLNYMDENYRGD